MRALLRPYHERLRAELERFGGTVEKFIGDAVMARLRRAGRARGRSRARGARGARDPRLRARRRASSRCGSASPPARRWSRSDARPEAGRGRWRRRRRQHGRPAQAAAPVNGILVGETTYRATERAIDYRERRAGRRRRARPSRLPSGRRVEARVALRRRRRQHEARAARRPRARSSSCSSTRSAARAGSASRSSSRSSACRASARAGSSAELFAAASTRTPSSITWRQGRSLPYGEGVSFWALGEMVKAQAGILETDAAGRRGGEARARPSRALVPTRPTPRWVERAPAPAGRARGGDERPAATAAARRSPPGGASSRRSPRSGRSSSSSRISTGRTTACSTSSTTSSTGRPACRCSSSAPRGPSCSSGGPAGAAASRTRSRLALAALRRGDRRLVHALLERSVLRRRCRQTLLERAGGNPLYAEEFVRMLARARPTDELARDGAGHHRGAPRRARAEEKALLQDAAVLGKVFWVGALAALGGSSAGRPRSGCTRSSARSSCGASADRRSPARPSTPSATSLVRDVAYGQIPRASERRSTVPRPSGSSRSAGREDHAEMLAHHYLAALELASAAGQDATAARRAARDVRSRDAGDRAFALNAFAGRRALLRRARARALARGRRGAAASVLLPARASASTAPGTRARAAALEEARDGSARAPVSPSAAAEADVTARASSGGTAATRRSRAACTSSARVSSWRARRPPPAKAHVLSQRRALPHARRRDMRKRSAIGGEALAMAEDARVWRSFRPHALDNIGLAQEQPRRSRRVVDDLERSIEIAVERQGRPAAARAIQQSRRRCSGCSGDFRACAHADRRGASLSLSASATQTVAMAHAANASIQMLFLKGEWDEALRRARASSWRACEAGEPHYLESGMRVRSRATSASPAGDVEGRARRRRTDGARRPVGLGDPQALFPSLADAAQLYVEAGESTRPGSLPDERSERWDERRICGSSRASRARSDSTRRRGELASALETPARTRRPWIDATARAPSTDDFVAAAEHASPRSAISSSRRMPACAPLRSSSPRAAAPRPTSSCARALAFYALRRRDALPPEARGAARGDRVSASARLRSENADGLDVLLRLRRRARPPRARPRGAQGRHLPLLRPRRLHGARRKHGPGGRATAPPALPRARPLRARALRRHRREVHRRRCHGRLRRADRARGRPRAGSAGRARDPRRARRGGRARGTHRDHHGRGADRTRRPTRCRRGYGLGRRREHRRPTPGGGADGHDPGRRDDLPRDASARSSSRSANPVEAKGKSEPVDVWKALRARAQRRSRASRRRGARRPRA